MSVQAHSWVYGTTTGSVARKAVLLVLANHAHPDGTAAYLHISTIAREAEVSERGVKRHLKELQQAGFIRPGDPNLLSHIRADKRPQIFDLAMSKARAAEWAEDWARGEDDEFLDDPDEELEDTADTTERGDTVSPGDGDGGPDDGVTTRTARGDNGDTPYRRTTLEPPPLPPGRGETEPTDDPQAGGCAACHGKRPCRACGTTPRQRAKAAALAAAERHRQQSAAATEASRNRAAQTSNVDVTKHVGAARSLMRKSKAVTSSGR